MAKILIIDDERSIRNAIREILEYEKFQVDEAEDGLQGVVKVKGGKYDVILCDIKMPKMDGIDVLDRIILLTPDTPVVMISGHGDIETAVDLLKQGAYDYIPKPFKVRELVARVKALLRRSNLEQENASGNRISVGDLVIDPARHEVICAGEPVEFTATEFRLLHYLAAHQGRVYSRSQLLDHAVGDDVVVSNRNIDVHIRSLRKKLCSCSELIETIRGVGYRFKETR